MSYVTCTNASQLYILEKINFSLTINLTMFNKLLKFLIWIFKFAIYKIHVN